MYTFYIYLFRLYLLLYQTQDSEPMKSTKEGMDEPEGMKNTGGVYDRGGYCYAVCCRMHRYFILLYLLFTAMYCTMLPLLILLLYYTVLYTVLCCISEDEELDPVLTAKMAELSGHMMSVM